MNKKKTVRMRAIISWEYDAVPEYYDTNDPVKIAAIDAENSPEDFLCVFDNVEKKLEIFPVYNRKMEEK